MVDKVLKSKYLPLFSVKTTCPDTTAVVDLA